MKLMDTFAGGAFVNGQLVTWGSELRAGSSLLAKIPATAGCSLFGGFVLQSGNDLLWWHDGRTELIDTHAAVVDMAEMTLLGRRGLLVIHRGMQLRFYERPVEADRWPYSEIYSFYTASEQGGLLQRDVDGNGTPDLICGNYWVKSPREFELPWQLFAINLFHKHPLAASARLAWLNGRLLWLESKRPQARAVWFTPPANPREQWVGEPLGIDLNFPRAVLVRGDTVWIGENNGADSRLIEWPSGKTIRRGTPLHTLIATPEGIAGIGPSGVIRL